MNKVTVRGVDGSHRDYGLSGGPIVIGRDPASGIHLKDSQVSWRHAVLIGDANGCVIEDLGSSNGTFVSSVRIQRHVLQPGERIKIGPYELVMHAAHAPSPNSASEQTLFAAADHYVRHHAGETGTSMQRAVVNAGVAVKDAVDVRDWRGLLKRWVPISQGTALYGKFELRTEVMAGLTVAALLVPQGIAYALLAGLPPVMGLYASMLPMILYALTGSGRQNSVGPVTVDSLMLVLGLSTIATAGTATYIALAILLTAVIGVSQLAMGALRLGFLVNFLSYPVLAGFTSAIAIITALGQLHHLLGIPQQQFPFLYEALFDVASRAGEANLATLAIGASCILLLLGFTKLSPKAPGPLTMVVMCTLLSFIFGLGEHGVKVLGEVPRGLPHLAVPEFDWAQIKQLLPLALTMALVGFSQTVSVGKSLGNKYGYDIDANRELAALGLANVSSSVSQGYVVSGSLGRSALNATAGARTPLAAIVTAFCVLLTALFFTPLFRYLPDVTLAAILVVSSLRLIDMREIRYLFNVKITEGLLLVFTFLATLIFGIMPGLLAGIVASILLFITLNTRPYTAILGRLPNTNIFRNVEHFPEAETIPGLVILRIDASLYFANVVFLKERIHEICDRYEGQLHALILDASAVNDLDSSADTALHQLSEEFKRKGIEFYIAGVKAPVRKVMQRSGLYERLGGDHFFFTIDAAVRRYLDKTGNSATRHHHPD
ncbi:sulfate permease [Steroidobacter sp.]|uniref:sulfate permease n=1 Tax=Steroidobacter sp. TaxID=1978227 RepID=UPI001A4B62D2|nr:sulfate permease [Steroidobacter sp.]MBL8269628.1 sulfate permease [Steroidobacter sp.]